MACVYFHIVIIFSVGTVSGMESMVAPSARSLMSKLVSAGDQGKPPF